MTTRFPSSFAWRHALRIAAVFAISACRAAQTIEPIQTCTPRKEQTSTSTQPSEVTFYRDILPILRSNVRGASYKCTTCHAEYEKPEGIANVPEVERAIAAMEARRMPRPGDPVPQEKIDLFKKWRLTGFKHGDPSTTPSESSTKSECKN